MQTDGLLLDLYGLTRRPRGRSRHASEPRRWAGTQIRDFYEPLWGEGLALINQGDIDTQQIAGAVATATHGSGIRYTLLGRRPAVSDW